MPERIPVCLVKRQEKGHPLRGSRLWDWMDEIDNRKEPGFSRDPKSKACPSFPLWSPTHPFIPAQTLLMGCVCVCVCVCVSYSVMSDSLQPLDCSLPGSSVHGILQARILEKVAIFFSRGSSWPRDWTGVSYITGRFIIIWVRLEAQPFS